MPFVLSFHIGKFGVALIGVFALVALVVGAGLTNSYGSGLRLETNTGWVSDGAPRDTVWNSHFVDIPGASVVGLHCHGRVQLSLQAGATGWPHNPCYEAMGLSSDSRGSSEIKFILPGGRKAVYKSNAEGDPTRWCIGNVIYVDSPEAIIPPTDPCSG